MTKPVGFRWNEREHVLLARFAFKWLLLAAPMAALVGAACAFFLWALDRATATRLAQSWLLFLLPLAGVGIVALYGAFGRDAERGNNLLMDAIHNADPTIEHSDSAVIVPRRMAPLVLVATVLTHLFGGSTGREGTAVQMGGSIASGMGRALRLDRADLRLLLMAGIAAGFGGVFGTPLAGTVFALEVLAVGQMRYEALIPCLIGGLVGDWASSACGSHHTHYSVGANPHALLNPLLAGKVALASLAFGLASMLFAELTHALGKLWKRIPQPLLRPVAGGCVIIALTLLLGTRDYLGLSVGLRSAPISPGSVTLQSCFVVGGVSLLSWWWKLLFTSVTLSSGFKGGEVTPLFFIGAALGNVLGHALGAPVDLFAALGFVGVFAGATNTPLACTLMGLELFGSSYAPYFALTCVLSYLFSGSSGIYTAQRVGVPKLGVKDMS